MYQLPFLLLISSVLAIGAFVFTNIITKPDHILGSVDAWAEERLPEFLYKPLFGCQYCAAGQWALWYYLVIAFLTKEVAYRFDVHVLFILITIYIEYPVTYLYNTYFKS